MTIAQRIVDQIRGLVGGYGAALYLVDDATGDMVAATTSGNIAPTFRPGLVFPRGSGVVALVLREGRAITSPNILMDSRVTLSSDNRTLVEQSPVRAVLAVPLMGGGVVIGAVSVGAIEGRIFSEVELALAQAFADQAAIAIQNSRLYQASVADQRRLATLVEVARKLTSRLDLPSVLETIATVAAEVFEAEVGFRLIEGDDLVRCGATPGALKKMVRERLKIGESISGQVAASGAPIVTSNVPADLRAIPEHRGGDSHTDALMCVPIRGGSKILGTLNIYREEGQHFHDDDLRIAMSLADQAGVALENAYLYGRLLQQAERTKALADVTRLLSETLDVEGVSQQIADSTCRLLKVHHVIIFRLEPESGDLVALACTDKMAEALGRDVRFPARQGAVGLAVEERGFVVSQNALTDPRITLTPELRRGIEQSPWRAVLAVPFLLGDRVIGAVGVGDREGRVFDEGEVRLVEAFAAQAARALENAKLYGDARRAYEDLSRAQADLLRVETLRAVGELAAGAAHHLNNLLAVVIGRLELALAQFEEPRLRKQLAPAMRAAQDGADLVRRLLRFSRRQTAPALVRVDVNDLVAEVVELTRLRWQNELLAQGVTVDVGLEQGEIPTIAGDPASLREVLLSLIFNAADAMPRGGRITITTWAAEDRVYCRVSDTGIGMSPDVHRRALEPFFTTKGVKSTGLGLSASYGIVQRHGGGLTIESTEGRGTHVTVRLPVDGMVNETPSTPPPASGPPLRILLVDDESEVRAVISDILCADGHHVIAAAHAADALAQFTADPSIDLVLTDLGMPGMTGWQLAQRLKASRPSLIVGVVTGWGELSNATPEDRALADFLVEKPITRDALRREIAQVRLHSA